MKGSPFLTFDCYGTLIDWERGIVDAFSSVAPAGSVVDPAALLAAYHAAEAEEEASYRPYAEILRRVGVRTLDTLGWAGVDPGFLPSSLPAWRPFADTRTALLKLVGAGCRLGILSNVDDALFDRTRGNHLAAVPFDVVVTAQQVRSYKPGRAHFDEARRRIERLAGSAVRWVHLAQSVRHDLVPCRALGIPAVHVDRSGQALQASLPDGAPDARVPDLATLADMIARGQWQWPEGRS